MLSTWTIPSDPGFETRRPSSTDRYSPVLAEALPKARVKPEALSNAIRNQGTLAQLFNPQARPYSVGSRPSSAQPKDFAKENVHRIKEMQKANREKQKESNTSEPVKAVYKPGKFDHVDSKVAQEVKVFNLLHFSETNNYLHRVGITHLHGSLIIILFELWTAIGDEINFNETFQHQPEVKNSNHVHENVRRAPSPLRPRPPSVIAAEQLAAKRQESEKRYRRGKVPKYLKNRQEQWKQDEARRIANTPDPSIPPGHTLMPREERLQTLASLEKNHEDLVTQLNALPVRVDTLRVKTKKSELEKKLVEIEDAIKIFSRPKVFVKLDD
ncbi:PREDICTED: enkurin domain-containing protein 1-like [Acropora digitifera]|uniref:enkurin domain-containing protein 1-like n=1 Tax=Acropora digitifera TaxID=70779 RepID=UPI00077A78DD|nr:PREDICTED: enkurin domain-containing protein 1-like [Acropora digitifera]